MEANHAEVVIGVHKTGQHNTKAPATLEESAAFRPPDQHTKHGTWHDQAEGNSSRCSKLDLSWMLFILGWVIAPCWWVGVAMGLTTGADNKFLVVRKQGLKPTQVKAWWANLSMTIISTVLVVLVCAIHLTRFKAADAGLEYSDTYYLAMSGPAGAFPDFNNAQTQLGVAQALHGALNLPSSYPATDIRVWLASQQAGSATTGRHLLTADSVIILGYALAKHVGLPEPEALKAMVEDSSTLGVVAQGLADARIVAPDFIKQVSVIMVAPDTNITPQQIVENIKSGALTPTPMSDIAGAPTGPFYLLMVGNEGMLPDLTNISVLSLVADALHSALGLDSAYKATDIMVTPADMWNQSRYASGSTFKAGCPARQLFELQPDDTHQTPAPRAESTDTQHVRVILQYRFATASGLTGMQLSARMSAPAATKALTHQLTLDGIEPLAHQHHQYLNLTGVRSLEAARALLQGQADVLEHYMVPIGKVDCQAQLNCDATTQGASGKLWGYAVMQEPLNGGKECPAATGPCTLPVDCKGVWVKHNCSARCGEGKWYEVYRYTQLPQDGTHYRSKACSDRGLNELHDGDLRLTEQTCNLLDCTCNGTWTEFSSCATGLQVSTFSIPTGLDRENSSSTCPPNGEARTETTTCQLPAPANCTAEWRVDYGSCNATCGPVKCSRVRYLKSPAEPGGACDGTCGQPVEYYDNLGLCCTGTPQPWSGNAAQLVKDWSCNEHNCTGSCIEGTRGHPTATCDNGQWSVDYGETCTPTACGIDFEGIYGATKLAGHSSHGMLWSGIVVQNRYGQQPDNAPWRQECTVGNTSFGTSELNAISGTAVFDTTVDSTNATGTVQAADPTSKLLALKNFYVMSVTNAATLTVSALGADGSRTGEKTVELVARVPQFVSTYDQPAFQQAASIEFMVQFGLSACGEGKTPVLVLDDVDVAPVLLPQKQPAPANTPEVTKPSPAPEASHVTNTTTPVHNTTDVTTAASSPAPP